MKKMKRSEADALIKKHWKTKTIPAICKETGMSETSVSRRAAKLGLPKKSSIEREFTVKDDIKQRHQKEEKNVLLLKYKNLLSEYDSLRQEIEMTRIVKPIQTFSIKPYVSTKQNEATAVILASDWHLGETVKREEVNGLNEYNREIAKKRSEEFFQNSLRIVEVLGKDIPIKHCVLALLGDFINNMLHDEATEMNSLLPAKEVNFAEDILASGIEYYLKNSTLDFTIVCHSGNHARQTKKQRQGVNEAGHSYEWLIYNHLAKYFKNEPRVTFIIPESYLSYVTVYDYTICFSHGHNVRYAGGIGGLTIPMLKAIAQWEQAKHADLYIIGHFHQLFDGGKFIVNGSMVGWNAYATSIKASFEKPKQMLFLVDKKRNTKTVTAPILFSC